MTGLADKIIGHYEKHATAWDALRQSCPWNDKIWHDRFIDGLQQGAHVLDLGCGPGHPIAQHMIDRGLRVTGIDSSPAMITLCHERLPGHEWLVADMRQLALGRRFDGILAWDSFFHLDYTAQRQMFAIFNAHASAGAVLMFNAGPEHGEAIGEFGGDPLYHASLAPSEYEALLDRSGFEMILHKANDPAAGGRTAWLCRRA
jgi:predicted TPR repeat methyltransferase